MGLGWPMAKPDSARNRPVEFERWKRGQNIYSLVDFFFSGDLFTRSLPASSIHPSSTYGADLVLHRNRTEVKVEIPTGYKSLPLATHHFPLFQSVGIQKKKNYRPILVSDCDTTPIHSSQFRSYRFLNGHFISLSSQRISVRPPEFNFQLIHIVVVLFLRFLLSVSFAKACLTYSFGLGEIGYLNEEFAFFFFVMF